ncbi:MAG: response regulator transcription factor [Trueperaceae bacterium]|nr:response regulator transcription factor [Trueperaceae bacterium]
MTQSEPADAMHRIYLVEDEPKLATMLAAHLERYGYEVVIARRFDDLKNEFLASGAGLVLLDVNLPWYDGFYWCRQIRTASNAPVIFISARSSGMDQVLAIDNGGDDYIVKPFNLEVVTAKVRGALRRAYGEYSNASEQTVTSAGLAFDPLRLVVAFDGRQVELSRNEGQLLEVLLRADGKVVGREALLEALWDDAAFVDDNTLTVNVNRLRKKLAELGLGDAVRTVRGAGYALQPPGGPG